MIINTTILIMTIEIALTTAIIGAFAQTQKYDLTEFLFNTRAVVRDIQPQTRANTKSTTVTSDRF